MNEKCHIKLNEVSLSFPLYANRDPNTKSFFVNLLGGGNTKDFEKKSFKAIDNVSFEIHENETVGIVGKNGAGKSTLIRLISNIYKPNSGYCEVKGHMVTLMGMGIGFNQNLDAIENIKVAGLIMGMSKEQIKQRTPEILEFAELEKFKNLPIKYYSTGMRTRLGFATATEIYPEILLLDEVFSGGDAHWLKKANARMRDIIERSKIVIMVSHSTERIKEFCKRIIWIKEGKIVEDGPTNEVMDHYLKGS